jgi:hypothetical protein
VPFGTRMYLRQNAAKRAAPVDLGRHGSGDGSTAFLGPACKMLLRSRAALCQKQSDAAGLSANASVIAVQPRAKTLCKTLQSRNEHAMQRL